MKKMTGKNTLMLFLTAFIWGTAFVAQSVGMDYIGPFTFTCVRSLIGGIFLIPCICFLDKWRAKNDGAERQKKADRKEEKKNVMEMISQALGHKHLDTTIRYLNVLDDKLRTASQEFYRRYSDLYNVNQFLESRR